MNQDTPLSPSPNRSRPNTRKPSQWLSAVVLVLGALLWFLNVTNYSLVGSWSDLVFPVAVGLLAFIAFVKAWPRTTGRGRLLVSVAHLPALLGGGLFVLSTLLLFVPPFTLGGLFAFDELAREKQIQQIESPDRRLTADVYFRGVGAYSGGNGRVDVRIRDPFVPFLERDVYYFGRSLANETSSDYVSWLDNRTLRISETGETVDVRGIKTGVAADVAIPLVLIGMLIQAAQEERVNQSLTAPVRDVPLYPSSVVVGGPTYSAQKANVSRSIETGDDLQRVVEWHRQQLATAPWQVVGINSHNDDDGFGYHTEVCIQATRASADGARIYYWELIGKTARGVHINIGTPKPITNACSPYATQPAQQKR
jgi:hypothetical protein